MAWRQGLAQHWHWDATSLLLPVQQKFVMAFSKLGLVPDCGGTWLLPRVAGRARAMGLALLGNQLSAEQAHEWGDDLAGC